jgi:hypothetical protein
MTENTDTAFVGWVILELIADNTAAWENGRRP